MKNYTLGIITLLVIIISERVISNSIEGCDIYVSRNGSDLNNCTTTETSCKTIEEGVKIAKENNVVCVFEGHYFIASSININKNISLISISGSNLTIIDGGNTQICVNFTADSDFYIDGFTFLDCAQQDNDFGAIQLNCKTNLTDIVVSNCVFEMNSGGIYNNMCGTRIVNFTAIENRVGLFCTSNDKNIHPNLIFEGTYYVVNNSFNIEDFPTDGSSDACTYNSEKNQLKNCTICYNGGNCYPTGECICLPGSEPPSPNCEFCKPGEFSDQNNSYCSPCNEQTYASGEGNAKCTACPQGTNNTGTGNYECTPEKMEPPISSALSAKEILINWTTPNTNFSIEKYVIALQNESCQNCQWTNYTIENDNDNSYIVTVDLSGKYKMKISAINSAGTGEWSDISIGETKNASVPDRVIDVNQNQTTKNSTSFVVYWSAPDNGGATINTYEVAYVQRNSTNNWTFSSTSGNQLFFQLENLLSGAYIIRVCAINSVGKGEQSENITYWTDPAVAPFAITTVWKSNSTSDSITLAWDPPVSNGGQLLTNYEIQITDSANKSYSKFVDPNFTTEIFDGLLSGNFTFKIRSLNGMTSPWSADFVFPTLPMTTPGKITTVSQASKSSSSIGILWDPPDTGGDIIANYTIKYKPEEDSTWTQVNTGEQANIYFLENLLSDNYSVEIAACNSIGEGPQSDQQIFSTKSPSVPSAITTIIKTGGTSSSLQIIWTAPEDFGGALIQNYCLYWKLHDDPIFLQNETGNNITVYNITGLESSALYDVKIASMNDVGWGDNSTVFEFESNPSTHPGQITPKPNCTNSTSTSLTIEWDTPDDGGAEITAYVVAWCLEGSSEWNTVVINTNSESESKSEFKSKLKSKFKELKSKFNNSEFNSKLKSKFKEFKSKFKSKFKELKSKFNNSKFNSKLKDFKSKFDNSKLKSKFKDFKSKFDNSVENLFENPKNGNSYTISSLLSGTYNIKVLARNRNGDGPYSDVLEAPTQKPNVPSKPLNLTFTANTASSISVRWEPPENNNGAEITGYQVTYVCVNDANNNGTQIVWGVSITANIINLLSDNYTISVSAMNAAGLSENISAVMQTADPEVPGAITDLSQVSASSTSIDIFWIPAQMNGRYILEYFFELTFSENTTVIRNIIFTNFTNNQTNLVYRIDNLLSANYCIDGYARNSIGNGSSTGRIIISTSDPSPPGQVVELFCNTSQKNETSIGIDWLSPSENGGADILNYLISYVQTGTSENPVLIFANKTSQETINLILVNLFSSNYTIKIKAQNSAGLSALWSPEIICDTTAATVPGEVNNMSLFIRERYRLGVEWPTPWSGGAEITSYRIYVYSENGTSYHGNFTTNSTSLIVDQNLDFQTKYGFLINACNSFGCGQQTLYSFVTLSKIPPPITNLHIIDLSYNEIVFGWDETDPYVINYIAEINNNTYAWGQIFQTVYTFVNVRPFSNYTVRIAALADNGWSSLWSDPINVTTSPSVPAQITSCKFSNVSSSSFSISWDVPSPNSPNISFYQIKLSSPHHSTFLNTPENSFYFSNLDSEVTYTVHIRALNEIGFAEWSPDFSCETKFSAQKATIIIIAVSGCFAFLALIVILGYYWKKKRRVVKITSSLSIYSVSDQIDDKEIDQIVTETITAEKSLYSENLTTEKDKLI